jgi:hypothetical protein
LTDFPSYILNSLIENKQQTPHHSLKQLQSELLTKKSNNQIDSKTPTVELSTYLDPSQKDVLKDKKESLFPNSLTIFDITLLDPKEISQWMTFYKTKQLLHSTSATAEEKQQLESRFWTLTHGKPLKVFEEVLFY